jgi:hypothetical protein
MRGGGDLQSIAPLFAVTFPGDFDSVAPVLEKADALAAAMLPDWDVADLAYRITQH